MLSNDTGIHAPLLSGLYDYNLFKIGAVGFPAVGGTYLDPVFGAVNPEGSTVKRLTDMTGTNPGQDIYAHHYINADGTFFFWRDGAGVRFVGKVSDGSIVRSGIPWSNVGAGKADVSWHPTDPNIFFYLNTADIRKYNVITTADVRVNSAGKFPTLEENGGFLDFVDATATKFCVSYGGAGHVYDSTTDTVYTGDTSPAAGTGGVWGMLPNAAYAVFFTTNAALADPSDSLASVYWAFPLDNVNHVVGTHFRFWDDASGSHSCFACASNGKTYMFRQENTSNGYYYIVEVKNQGSSPHSTIIADSANVQLFTNGWNMDTHYSGSILGLLKDWVFIDTEYPSDAFDGPVTGWLLYENEIIAVNVITHEIRRLCHHRSRSCQQIYDYQPRVSCAWDGSAIMWASNFNYTDSPGHGAPDSPDAFAIQNPLGTAGGGGSLSDPDDGGWISREPQTNPSFISLYG